MFWGKKKTDDDKEKQIRQLKQAFPSLRRPNNDDTLFEIRFVGTDGQSNSLRVFIPSDFPLTRPVLQVSGPLTHPWLDQFKQVNGSQKLLAWNKNSLLVEVVEESLNALMNGGINAAQPGNAINATPVSRDSLAGGRPSIGGGGGVAMASAYPTAAPTATPTATPYGVTGGFPTSGVYAGMAAVYPAQAANTNNNPAVYASATPAPNTNGYAATTANPNLVSNPTMRTPTPPIPVNPYGSPAPTPTSSSRQPAVQTIAPTPSPSASAKSGGVANSKSESSSSIAMPEIPRHFPELENMTVMQLQRLLKDPVALEAHADRHVAALDMMRSMLEDLRKDNLSQATHNVLLQDELLLLRSHAIETKRSLQRAHDDYLLEHTQYVQHLNGQPEKVLASVREQQVLSEKVSEQVSEKFLAGQMDLHSFLQSYMEERTKYHTLAHKANSKIIKM
eukprot:gene33865-40974_t